jgi:hypothetical protein
MKQYCITGINKLTNERDVITVPCSLPTVLGILKREKAKAPHRQAYKNLKIEFYPPPVQLELQFKE